jgi:RNA ligase (TIGR02306 family)
MRKLATIQVIKDIQPIDGADAIEVATVNGWKAVIQKGIYSVGQKIVYLEIDSWVPHNIAPFLSKGKEPRVYQGVAGERLQTISLRKQISQGLICPLSSIPTYYQDGSDEYYTDLQDGIREVLINDDCIGRDVTYDLGVLKWEREIPAQLAGQARGDFPSFLIKTDEERVQNLSQYFPAMYNTLFVLHEKLDGCVSDNTLIAVRKNGKELQITAKELACDINEYEILSYNIDTQEQEYTAIGGVMVQDNIDNWYEIELENGTKLSVTGNHKIWLKDLECYRKVEDLDGTEELLYVTINEIGCEKNDVHFVTM